MKRLLLLVAVAVLLAFLPNPSWALDEQTAAWKTKKIDGTGNIRNFMETFEDAMKALPPQESMQFFKELWFMYFMRQKLTSRQDKIDQFDSSDVLPVSLNILRSESMRLKRPMTIEEIFNNIDSLKKEYPEYTKEFENIFPKWIEISTSREMVREQQEGNIIRGLKDKRDISKDLLE